MTDGPTGLTPRSAYLVHFAMVMSLAVVTGVFWVVRDAVDPSLTGGTRLVLRCVALTELVFAGFVVARLRAGTTLQAVDGDAAEWWLEHGARVMSTWSLALGAAITGAVCWLLTGDGLILAAVVVAALVILIRLGPAHWRAEPTYRSHLVD